MVPLGVGSPIRHDYPKRSFPPAFERLSTQAIPADPEPSQPGKCRPHDVGLRIDDLPDVRDPAASTTARTAPAMIPGQARAWSTDLAPNADTTVRIVPDKRTRIRFFFVGLMLFGWPTALPSPAD
jgi:hypothetical protein